MRTILLSLLLISTLSTVAQANLASISRPEPFCAMVTLAPEPAKIKLRLTATSKVYLDGQERPFEDVPSGCTITEVQLEEDQRTIIAIWFRSKP